MSITRVAGHPDYSSAGTTKWIPEVWSRKIAKKYYPVTNLTAICNRDYEPEVKGFGDKVYIRSIADINTFHYQKGMTLPIQHPESPNLQLNIDHAEGYNIYLDDVDKVQQDIDQLNKFTEDAAKQLAKTIETDVLANVYADADSHNYGATAGAITGKFDLGASGAPKQITAVNSLHYIVDAGTVLGENDIPPNDCWMLVPEWVGGVIQKSDIKDASLTGDPASVLRTNVLGKVGRFNILTSNLLPTVAAATEASGYLSFYILFGNKDAITFANQVTNTRRLESELTMAQIVRGLMVYGYAVTAPKALGYIYCRM